MKLRSLILVLMTFALATGGYARGNEDESLGEKVKKFFAGPTPTPRKKHKTTAKKKTTPTPTPTPTAAPSSSPSLSPSPSSSPSPAGASSPSPSPTNSPTPMQSPAPPAPAPSSPPTQAPAPAPSSPNAYPAQSPRSRPHAPIIEPVRPINPGPHHRRRVEAPPPGVTIPSPAEQRPTPIGKISPPVAQQTPAPQPTSSPSATVMPTISASPAPQPTASPTATPEVKRKPTAPATISANEIAGYENYPASVRKILDLSLGLTTQNLGYKYGSADPKNGGMDCSGFIYYLLTQMGVKDPPRDAREQYIWVRKAGNFQAVLAHRDDSFELDALKPGDLLFWSGTYFVDRDPAITHTMIYLGRERGTNQRIMAGSSDGRSYKGQQRFGVSVFDFKISAPKPKTDDKPTPVFVGYGRIPGFKDE